jgi:hypothetical protein
MSDKGHDNMFLEYLLETYKMVGHNKWKKIPQLSWEMAEGIKKWACCSKSITQG